MADVIGLIRFSYLSSDATEYRRTRNAGLRARAHHVLDPARLARRFELFEAVCLPALAAQPEERFAALLLTSAALPEAFRARLEELVAPYPALRAVYAEPAACAEVFAGLLEDMPCEGSARISFRLDDDDAIPADYTERALGYSDARYAGHCLSFYRGYGLGRVRGRLRLWRRERPMASAGLGFVAAAGDHRTIYHCGDHQRVAERFPTILDGRRPGFLQTAHGANDSGNRVPWRVRLDPAASEAPEDAGLADAFPLLAGAAIGRL